MPRGVKKSTTSAATGAAEGNTPGEQTRHPQEKERPYGIDDYMLPKATVTRLAKHVLPANTQIQKDAMTALSKSATVFINYLTSTANDLTVGAGRRTVNPTDVYKAIELLELEFILPRLKAEVDKYVEAAATKQQKKPAKVAATSGTVDEGDEIVVPGQERTEGDGGEDTLVIPVAAAAAAAADDVDDDDDGVIRTTKKAKLGNGKGVARQPSVRDEEETEVEDTEEDEAEDGDDDDAGHQADGSSAEDAFEDAQDRMDEGDINEDGTLEMNDTPTMGNRQTSFHDRVLAKDPDALSGTEDEDSD
ncbi:histone-fold-containing protein [Lipomyces kononenkoae]